MSESSKSFPRYKLLTGQDNEAFCRQVSEALDMGFELYGSPVLTFDGTKVTAAQAVIWSSDKTLPEMPEMPEMPEKKRMKISQEFLDASRKSGTRAS